MGTATPEQESAPDHELVSDDELLVEGAAAPVARVAPDAPRAAPLRARAPALVPIRVADVLAGKYRVERVHAPGALGVTCDAQHLQLRQRVVLKLCLAEAEISANFLESARMSAQLRSVHLARVLDLGTLESGIAYCVTEHLSGTDLRGVLRVREWLPVEEAVDYVLQICEALAVAHVAGFVHRNLKPSNVFLAREGDARPIIKVLDPCLAGGALTDALLAMSVTESQLDALTYWAPERVREPSAVDVRADVWAIGALLHELLTGSPLHRASNLPGIFAAIAADEATPMSQLRSEIPRELEEIVLRCLEKEVDYRWPDVGTLARQLRRFASDEGRAAVDRVISVLERRPRSVRSSLPPPSRRSEPPRLAVREVADAARGELSPNRRLLEVGLAVLAILGCSVGVGALITIRNLQTILSTRGVGAQPVVASLSPALPAAVEIPRPLQAVPAALPSASAELKSAAPTSLLPITSPASQIVNQPAARTRADAPASPPATVPSEHALAEPRSTQALFDSAN